MGLMTLLAPADANFPNLGVIREVLEQMGGNEEVEFDNGTGAGVLRYQNGTSYNVHIAIPLHWLAEPAQSKRVGDATLYFAAGVRVASQREARPA